MKTYSDLQGMKRKAAPQPFPAFEIVIKGGGGDGRKEFLAIPAKWQEHATRITINGNTFKDRF